jgi:hypothetical protein
MNGFPTKPEVREQARRLDMDSREDLAEQVKYYRTALRNPNRDLSYIERCLIEDFIERSTSAKLNQRPPDDEWTRGRKVLCWLTIEQRVEFWRTVFSSNRWKRRAPQDEALERVAHEIGFKVSRIDKTMRLYRKFLKRLPPAFWRK